MLRNHKEQLKKEYLRLDRKRDQLRKEFRKPTLIPLTEKIMMGWDVSLELIPNISISDEAPILNQVLTVLKLNEPIFIKNVKWLKQIRKNAYSFTKYVDDAHLYGLSYWFRLRKRITEKEYLSLTPQLKHYFYKQYLISDYYEQKKPYKLSERYFHFYNLKFRVRKSYATHQAIPDHRLEYEDTRITYFLEDEVHFYGSKNGFHKDWSYNKDITRYRAKRRSWKAALSQMKNQDEETQEFILSKTKAFKRFKI